MSDRSPLVSVIIIVRDGEPFLDEAITSVRKQTFTDWELAVVDDGSTDGSIETARRHAREDSRISCAAHPDGGNHGMSATRNLGLALTTGELVAFLDADDVWEPTKLEEQVAILRDHPRADLVYGRTLIWHSWRSGAPADDYCYDLGVEPDRVVCPPVLFRQLMRNRHQTPTMCNAMVRRRAIEAVGGFEDEFRSMYEDQVFFAKLLLHSSAYVADPTWAKYRQHERSASAAAATARQERRARATFLRWARTHVVSSTGRWSPERALVERKVAQNLVRLAGSRLRHVARSTAVRTARAGGG